MNETSSSCCDRHSATGAGIALEGVSLRFRRFGGPSSTLKAAVVDTVLRRRYSTKDDFWIFENLNLTIRSGERVGIIGPNGAGKTTLVKLLAGIYEPASGTVNVVGRVAPLIELSTGLNHELSGLENIYLMGALLGHGRREMENRTRRIIEFAGLEDYVSTPMKYYSTGMLSRLAFSIATDVEADILLMDEVFSGGDAEFVPRATARMMQLMDASHIVVFVSHQLDLVSELTDRVIWLDHGRIVRDGDAQTVCEEYLATAQPDQLPARKVE